MTTLTNIQNIITASNNITVAQLGADGQKVVTDAVAAAEAVGGTGPLKFSAALAQAGTDLLALGKDVGLFVLHIAIEAAVAQLSVTQAASAPVTPTPAITPPPAS